MGCTASVYRVGVARKKMKNIPQVTIFVPSVRVPLQSHLQNSLLPNHLAHRLASLRNQIVFFTQLTDGSAIPELHASLQEYLSLLVGLTHNHKERGLEQLVEFKWKNLENGQEVGVANSLFELLSVVHMMAMLTLTEANAVLTHNQTSSTESLVTADSMRSGIDLLLKAAGHLEFSIRDILVHIPPDIKIRLPQDLQAGVLEATSFQALGQGTEMQLALAVESKNATLSVKRRLACEQLTYFSQAHYCLSTCNNNNGYGKKHLLFIKWKYLEAKAAAYYFHGLITDKGTESSCHISAVCCFLAAEELLLKESKKACLSFCLAVPVTRVPPPWGAMKYLNRKIPETASRKSQMYGYLLEGKKDLGILPELPEFQLSLKADDYQLPEMDSEWDNKHLEIPSRTLEEPLGDSEDEMEPK